MDPKRRACVALQALFEIAQQHGTKTFVPEYVVERIIRASEDPRPESLLAQADRWRFWRKLTNEELAKLIDEYYAASHLDDERGAMTELDLRQRSVR